MVYERKGQLITVEIDRVLYERVREQSQQTGVSISFKVREALSEWTERLVCDECHATFSNTKRGSDALFSHCCQ